MQALRLMTSGGAITAITDLPLRMPQVGGEIDPEPFRVAAAGGAPLRDAMATCGPLRTLHLLPGQRAELFGLTGSRVTFVLAGRVKIAAGTEVAAALDPGDMVLTDEALPASAYRTVGECRLLQLAVDPGWPGEKARPVPPVVAVPRESPPNFRRMYEGADGRSYFRLFTELFAAPGAWSRELPVAGLRFVGMSKDTFIDWHPEVTNNLAIVLAGALELETGGGIGERQVFGPGDVCLAEDWTGEGHIDRVRAGAQVAILTIDDRHLWPVAAGR